MSHTLHEHVEKILAAIKKKIEILKATSFTLYAHPPKKNTSKIRALPIQLQICI